MSTRAAFTINADGSCALTATNATAGLSTNPVALRESADEYRIEPRDFLSFGVFRGSDHAAPVPVHVSGHIDFSPIGPVSVAGRGSAEISPTTRRKRVGGRGSIFRVTHLAGTSKLVLEI